MAELAAGGGCLTADMNDPAALAQAIASLATNRSLRDRLSAEARARDIDAWPDYARHVGKLLDLAAAPEGDAGACAAALRRRVAEDAPFMDHRLQGVGLISGIARAIPMPAPVAPPPPADAPPQAPPRVDASRLGLLSIFGRRRVTARRVRDSGLFDAAWYLAEYPDVRESGMDPAWHFARHGHREGRSPGPNFDSARYLAEQPDAASSGLSPFAHYLSKRR